MKQDFIVKLTWVNLNYSFYSVLFQYIYISHPFFMKKLLFISVVLLWGTIQTYSSELAACTKEYVPVCWSVQVQCVAAPCNPIKETFSNLCLANAAHATEITQGKCWSIVPPVIWGDRDAHGCIGSAGYIWSITDNQCIRPWEKPKMTTRQVLQDATWKIVSLNGKAIQSKNGTINFYKNTFSAKICNNINGQYGTFAGALIFRKVISTMMYCDGDIMMVENAMNFARAKFRIDLDNLIITTKSGEVMVWKKSLF